MSVSNEQEFVDAICGRLSTNLAAYVAANPAMFPYTPSIAWQDRASQRPEAGKLRLRFFYKHTLTRQTTLGQPPRFMTRGLFYAQIYAPAGQDSSPSRLLNLADAIEGFYRGVTEPNGVWYRDVTKQAQPPSAEWISSRVGGKYQFDRYNL